MNEWRTILSYGSKLRAKEGWNGSGNGADNLGFAALPGGYGNSEGGFSEAGNFAGWLNGGETGTYDHTDEATYYMLHSSKAFIESYDYANKDGYCIDGNDCKISMLSVRCVKDYACGDTTYSPYQAYACCANAIPYGMHQFCYKSKVYESCNHGDDHPDYRGYNPETQFCGVNRYTGYLKTILEKCGGKEYDASKEYCSGGAVKEQEKCGDDKYYIPDTEYCLGSEVKEKENCGGEGGELYNPETQLCINGNVYEKMCGEKEYDPQREYCHTDGKTYSCGEKPFDPAKQFCKEDIIWNKCGGKEHNPETEYCSAGSIRKYGFLKYGEQTYKSVEIGKQTWMAENLSYAAEGSVCYGNKPENCEKYGRLYNWATALEVCPEGWHLPSKNEWEELSRYIEKDKGCSNCDAKHLKWVSGWSSGGDGLGSYGFAALPGGSGNPDGLFNGAGNFGYWWSSSEDDAYNAYSRRMYYTYEYADWPNGSKTRLSSVRCIKD